jgi:hypothetical protein
MSDYIIPEIGSGGSWVLKSPLQSLMVEGEYYICQAVRKLSEYLANNENPLKSIYTALGIGTEYGDDVVANMEIVSLQSSKGHWVYIPARYIIKYPNINGKAYRTMMLGVSLPSMPVDQDLSHIETDLVNFIHDRLGVTPVIKHLETSRPVMVDESTHTTTMGIRNMAKSQPATDAYRYSVCREQLTAAMDKISKLEEYIFSQGL